jgi:hypothetical protein
VTFEDLIARGLPRRRPKPPKPPQQPKPPRPPCTAARPKPRAASAWKPRTPRIRREDVVPLKRPHQSNDVAAIAFILADLLGVPAK